MHDVGISHLMWSEGLARNEWKNMYHLTVLFCPRWHVCLGTPFRKVQTEGIRFWVCGWRYFCSFCSCPCTFWVHAWFHHSRYLLVCLKFCVVCVCFVLLLWCGHGACWLRLHEDSSDGLACLLMLYWYWWWLSRVANARLRYEKHLWYVVMLEWLRLICSVQGLVVLHALKGNKSVCR